MHSDVKCALVTPKYCIVYMECMYWHGFLYCTLTNGNVINNTCAQQAAAKKKKMDKDDEERVQEAIERQIERALASKTDVSVYKSIATCLSA